MTINLGTYVLVLYLVDGELVDITLCDNEAHADRVMADYLQRLDPFGDACPVTQRSA